MSKLRKLAGLLTVVIAVSAIAGISVGDAEPQSPRKSFPAPEGSPFTELISGYEFRSQETRELQDDDFLNPGFLWVETGEENWSVPEGEAGKSCATCHGDAEESMKGVATTFPKVAKGTGELQALQHRINTCRVSGMKAEPWGWESDEMLGMTAFVKLQSRGLPMSVAVDGPAAEYMAQGKEFYYQRRGQLDMACASCHEANNGKHIRADMLSQGHSNGFPTYRLKWQKLGSLHRRFKGCNKNIRAQPYKAGSPEYTALELYLGSRGQGLPLEAPSVRQ